MSLIIGDYAASFLGLSAGLFWDIHAFDVRFSALCSLRCVLNHERCSRPIQEIKTKDGVVLPRGQGNHVSVEFNMLYRVRSTPFLDLLIKS